MALNNNDSITHSMCYYIRFNVGIQFRMLHFLWTRNIRSVPADVLVIYSGQISSVLQHLQCGNLIGRTTPNGIALYLSS